MIGEKWLPFDINQLQPRPASGGVVDRMSLFPHPILRPEQANNLTGSEGYNLLVRAGYFSSATDMSGTQIALPLGLRFHQRITGVISGALRARMAEVCLPLIQSPGVWKASGRLDKFGDEIFTIPSSAGDIRAVLAATNEAMVTHVFQNLVKGGNGLPIAVFLTEPKFRNEIRPRGGPIRGVEFLMNDSYVACRTQEELDEYYGWVLSTYSSIFTTLGLNVVTVSQEDTGAIGGNKSNEFIALHKGGETKLVRNEDGQYSFAEEGMKGDPIIEGTEVGHAFDLGPKYSQAGHNDGLDWRVKGPNNETFNPLMMSAGIGIGRTGAIIAEVNRDNRGLRLPAAVAPYQFHMVVINPREEGQLVERANEIAWELAKRGFDVLIDDRQLNPGEKFNTMDLLGMPYQVVVSSRTIAAGGDMAEFRER